MRRRGKDEEERTEGKSEDEGRGGGGCQAHPSPLPPPPGGISPWGKSNWTAFEEIDNSEKGIFYPGIRLNIYQLTY